MVTRLSRYRNVPDEETLDARGRRTRSRGFRPAPAPGGAVRHTLTATDRLDLLAHRYYRQPRKWWRICDANPEFLSPFALLGTEPLVTVYLVLRFTGFDLRWVELLSALSLNPAIVEAKLEWEEEQRTDASAPCSTGCVVVIYNRMVMCEQALMIEVRKQVCGCGFVVEAVTVIGRVGKPILIPPDVVR